MRYFVFSISLHVFVGLIGSIVLLKKNKLVDEPILKQKVMLEFALASEKTDVIKSIVEKKVTKSFLNDVSQVIEKIEKQKKSQKISKSNLKDPIALDYTTELKYYLEKSKHYPRQAIRLKQSGVVEVQVKIDASGLFSEIQLSKASMFPMLDDAALNLLKKIGRFKPLPKNIPANSNFTIPIAYVMGGAQ